MAVNDSGWLQTTLKESSLSFWDYGLFAVNFVYIIFGSLSVLLNGFVLFAIIRGKIVKKDFALVTVDTLCFSGLLQSLAYVVAGSVRLTDLLEDHESSYNQLQCYFACILFYFTVPFWGFTMMIVAAERLYLVAYPLHYHRDSPKVLGVALTVNLIGSLIVSLLGLINVSDSVSAKPCIVRTGTSPLYYLLWSYLCRLTPIAFCCCIYTVVVFLFRKRKRRISVAASFDFRRSSICGANVRSQNQIAKMAATICIAYLSLTGVGTLSLVIFSTGIKDATIAAVFTQASSTLILCNCIANAFIFTYRLDVVRRAVKDAIRFLTFGKTFKDKGETCSIKQLDLPMDAFSRREAFVASRGRALSLPALRF